MVSMLKLILNMVGALLNAQIYNMLFNNHFSTGKLKKAFNFIDVMLRKDDFMDFCNMRRTEEAEDLTQHMVSTALIKRRCGCIKLSIVLIKSWEYSKSFWDCTKF